MMFESEITALKSQNLHRQLRVAETPQGIRTVVDGRELINFSSNDYLGLAFHPDVIRGAQKAAGIWGTGAGASRLISGTTAIHAELEDRLARWVGTEAALVFPSGFQTNLGVIQALVGTGDEVYVDRFVHASLVDGARASGAKLKVYPHRDVEKLGALLAKPFTGKRLILTDSYFSMDGDCAPLLELVELSEKFDAMLVVDEAHAFGVYGDHGRGLLYREGSARLGGASLIGRVTAVIGTLSKSLGSQGGFVAGSAELKDFLINKARAFIYTTGFSPTLCGAALAALNIVEKTDAIRDELWGRVDFARTHLRALGLDLGDSEGPIIPVILGDTRRALAWADQLREAGILGVAIRPPTVPKGTDRIRLTVTAKHTADNILRLTGTLKKLL